MRMSVQSALLNWHPIVIGKGPILFLPPHAALQRLNRSGITLKDPKLRSGLCEDIYGNQAWSISSNSLCCSLYSLEMTWSAFSRRYAEASRSTSSSRDESFISCRKSRNRSFCHIVQRLDLRELLHTMTAEPAFIMEFRLISKSVLEIFHELKTVKNKECLWTCRIAIRNDGGKESCETIETSTHIYHIALFSTLHYLKDVTASKMLSCL